VGALADLEFVRNAMVEAARVARAEVREAVFHQFFPPGIAGVSGTVILSESHLAIHTWPEKRYAAIDCYTCGTETDPHAACEFLARVLGAVRSVITFIERGIPDANGQYAHTVMSEFEALAQTA
jgi:S-adenosylmethionine decarboxylase